LVWSSNDLSIQRISALRQLTCAAENAMRRAPLNDVAELDSAQNEFSHRQILETDV